MAINDVRINSRITIPSRELEWSFARSSGPGGQHVNRSETKVVLRWNLESSQALDDKQKSILQSKLASKLTASGDLIVTSEQSRDRERNKQDAIQRFQSMLQSALRRPKKRIATRPTKSSVEKRIKEKKKQGEKKRRRQTFD